MNTVDIKNSHNEYKEKVIKGFLILAATISILTTFGVLFSILFEALNIASLLHYAKLGGEINQIDT